MKYDTEDKRISTIKKKGNIITFKTPFQWKGESYKQIMVTKLKNDTKTNAVKIIGFTRDSNWYESIEKLLESIDWEWMDDMQGDSNYKTY